jgi:shikimate dehydrogenase
MIKLGLVGKNIQHSKSPEIYRRLINGPLEYDLLDYSSDDDIPSATKLLSLYRGISITSPYKKHFLNEVKLTEQAKILGAINCLKFENGNIIGENTDYMAIVDILKNWQTQFQQLNVVILGDGVMSKITQIALDNLKIEYRVLSRKLIDSFDQINLEEYFIKNFDDSSQSLIINTCAREYVYRGKVSKNSIFWDYNYNFTPHLSALPLQLKQYSDGYEMLELQARYALVFWSINTSI